MSSRALVLCLSFAAFPALASPPTAPAENPVTTAAVAPQMHSLGVVTALDAAAQAISVSDSDGAVTTWHYTALVLDAAIQIGSSVDVSHLNGSMQASSVAIQGK